MSIDPTRHLPTPRDLLRTRSPGRASLSIRAAQCRAAAAWRGAPDRSDW
jgi:hypothetical protein